MPVVRSHSIEQIEKDGEGVAGRMDAQSRAAIAGAGLRACIATTDVHEYGKILVETVLRERPCRVILETTPAPIERPPVIAA